MAIAIISVLSSIAAVAASLGVLLLSSRLIPYLTLTGEDLKGFAVFSFVPSLLMCALLYTPGLMWLRKRRGECRPAKLFVFVSALLLNIPAFAFLAYSAATGGFFGEGEEWYFVIAFVAAGTVYALGYVRHCRRETGG